MVWCSCSWWTPLISLQVRVASKWFKMIKNKKLNVELSHIIKNRTYLKVVVNNSNIFSSMKGMNYLEVKGKVWHHVYREWSSSVNGGSVAQCGTSLTNDHKKRINVKKCTLQYPWKHSKGSCEEKSVGFIRQREKTMTRSLGSVTHLKCEWSTSQLLLTAVLIKTEAYLVIRHQMDDWKPSEAEEQLSVASA